MNSIYILGLITNRGMRERFIQFFKEYHIEVSFATLGRGTASSSLLDYLGMEDTEKAIYFAVITQDTWQALRKVLYTRMQIDVPGRGIAFLVPLSSVGGKHVLQYLTAGQKIEIEEESILQNTEYELLVAIANSGYTENIMDAARSARAPGGTIIHAKGTGAEHAKKFLGISLAEEKEMVFIVVKSTRKKAIMKAIMDEAGIDTKAGTVVFSLPVTETAGLRVMDEMEED
ncbi:MAG TPA: P-II family nitrogen regulator [Candidatus Dorea gallistercoris]|uniref:P-II family nitrogen regulator n=1 Tax=Candidatus Dorea gallistercoris TaxID=2838542 RepID=A0A9D1UE72_9FIRM|nr:P-II family nitrogen regulator [Candidatus Dorea gallistercoris]